MKKLFYTLGTVIDNWEILYENSGNGWRVKCTNCGIELDKTASEIKRFSRAFQKNKPKVCKYCRNRPKGESGLIKLRYTYLYSAKLRGLTFKITLEQFRKLTSLNCHYCGRPPKTLLKTNPKCRWGDYYYNGIDRVESNIGYTNTNCVSCCAICNRAKSNMTYNEWIEYLDCLTAFHYSTYLS